MDQVEITEQDARAVCRLFNGPTTPSWQDVRDELADVVGPLLHRYVAARGLDPLVDVAVRVSNQSTMRLEDALAALIAANGVLMQLAQARALLDVLAPVDGRYAFTGQEERCCAFCFTEMRDGTAAGVHHEAGCLWVRARQFLAPAKTVLPTSVPTPRPVPAAEQITLDGA